MHVRAGGIASGAEKTQHLPGQDRLTASDAEVREVAIKDAHAGVDRHDDVQAGPARVIAQARNA
jgi:hypothetical protein